LSSEINSLIPI